MIFFDSVERTGANSDSVGSSSRGSTSALVHTTSDFCRDHLRHTRVAAKLERRRILERAARGQADAKAKGVKFGRKLILTPHQQKEARARLDAGETQRSVARSYNVSQSTISRLAP
jgi:DNA invertase Pin-like site-specific DNA recombinase